MKKILYTIIITMTLGIGLECKAWWNGELETDYETNIDTYLDLDNSTSEFVVSVNWQATTTIYGFSFMVALHAGDSCNHYHGYINGIEYTSTQTLTETPQIINFDTGSVEVGPYPDQGVSKKHLFSIDCLDYHDGNYSHIDIFGKATSTITQHVDGIWFTDASNTNHSPTMPYFYLFGGSSGQGLSNSSIEWYSPDDGQTYNNEFPEWWFNVYLDQDDLTQLDFLIFYVSRLDSANNYVTDVDLNTPETFTGDTEFRWSVPRTGSIADGAVWSYAEIKGYYDCDEVGTTTGCAYTSMIAETPTIKWYMSRFSSHTPYNNPYMLQPGFVPEMEEYCLELATEEVDCTETNYFSCSLKKGWHWLLNPSADGCVKMELAKQKMQTGFPMNIVNNIKQSYNATTSPSGIHVPLHWWKNGQYQDTGVDLLASTTLANALDFGNIDGLSVYDFYYLWFQRFIWLCGIGYIAFRLFGGLGFHAFIKDKKTYSGHATLKVKPDTEKGYNGTVYAKKVFDPNKRGVKLKF